MVNESEQNLSENEVVALDQIFEIQASNSNEQQCYDENYYFHLTNRFVFISLSIRFAIITQVYIHIY